MKKYVFRVYTTYDPDDGFNVWTSACNRQEAESEIRREYHCYRLRTPRIFAPWN